MSKDKAKSLSELIDTSGSALGSLASQARRQAGLADYLRKNLPPELAPGFVHCNLKAEGLLVVLAANSEWASRLRFEGETFIGLCAQQGTTVNEVKVRVGAG